MSLSKQVSNEAGSTGRRAESGEAREGEGRLAGAEGRLGRALEALPGIWEPLRVVSRRVM